MFQAQFPYNPIHLLCISFLIQFTGTKARTEYPFWSYASFFLFHFLIYYYYYFCFHFFEVHINKFRKKQKTKEELLLDALQCEDDYIAVSQLTQKFSLLSVTCSFSYNCLFVTICNFAVNYYYFFSFFSF